MFDYHSHLFFLFRYFIFIAQKWAIMRMQRVKEQIPNKSLVIKHLNLV